MRRERRESESGCESESECECGSEGNIKKIVEAKNAKNKGLILSIG